MEGKLYLSDNDKKEGWIIAFSNREKRAYYYNTLTQESRWDHPDAERRRRELERKRQREERRLQIPDWETNELLERWADPQRTVLPSSRSLVQPVKRRRISDTETNGNSTLQPKVNEEEAENILTAILSGPDMQILSPLQQTPPATELNELDAAVLKVLSEYEALATTNVPITVPNTVLTTIPTITAPEVTTSEVNNELDDAIQNLLDNRTPTPEVNNELDDAIQNLLDNRTPTPEVNNELDELDEVIQNLLDNRIPTPELDDVVQNLLDKYVPAPGVNKELDEVIQNLLEGYVPTSEVNSESGEVIHSVLEDESNLPTDTLPEVQSDDMFANDDDIIHYEIPETTVHSDEVSSDELQSDETSSDELSIGEWPAIAEELQSDDVSSDELSIGEWPAIAEELQSDELAIGEWPAIDEEHDANDKLQSDEEASDELSIGEWPVIDEETTDEELHDIDDAWYVLGRDVEEPSDEVTTDEGGGGGGSFNQILMRRVTK